MLLIIGESNYDVYTYTDSSQLRFAPEAPVPILKVLNSVKTVGMAGNVARNVAALNYPFELRTNPGWTDILKTRYVDSQTNHMFVRIDSDDKVARIEGLNKINWDAYEAVLISDYNKGFLHDEDIRYITKKHPVTFIDTKRKLGPYLDYIGFIKVNEPEYNATKETISDRLAPRIITTLGKNGARFQDKVYPVEEVEIKDLSGLGDCHVASMCVAYIKTKNIQKSIQFANDAATFCAQKRGVSVIDPEELEILNRRYDL